MKTFRRTFKNYREHFEDVYLRDKILSKALKSVDAKILHHPDFKKITKYLANKFYKKYQHLLSHTGFEYDDILSIVQIYGLSFFGHCQPRTLDTLTFKYAMRYITQRFQYFLKCVTNKFSLNENYTFSYEKLDLLGQNTWKVESCTANSYSKTALLKRRRLLKKNINEYRDILCYYATSKAVSYSVRRRAQKICRQYRIDYLAWLKNQAYKMHFDQNLFIHVGE